MIKYYVGIGRDLFDPARCDGPFATPEGAKAFMKEFDRLYMAPEMLEMTITQVDDEAMTIDFYKENDKPVTMRDI